MVRAIRAILLMKIVPQIVIEGRSALWRSHPKGSLGESAAKLAKDYETVYVQDEDGIFKNRPQLDVAREVCEEVPALYEGGVRYSQNLIDALITGAEKAVIGTATLVNVEELEGAFKLSENITFKVDFRDGIVSFDPDIAGRALVDLIRDVNGIGIADIVVPTSLASEASQLKEELGFSLGVFASVRESARLSELGVDYLVADDYGSKDRDD
jgi:uncharacterized protein related to proFAR isomerase